MTPWAATISPSRPLAAHADKHIAHLAIENIDRLDKKHAIGAAGFDKAAGRYAADVIALGKALRAFLRSASSPTA